MGNGLSILFWLVVDKEWWCVVRTASWVVDCSPICKAEKLPYLQCLFQVWLRVAKRRGEERRGGKDFILDGRINV